MSAEKKSSCMRTDREVVFFGCPLDCDEKFDSIQEKILAEKRSEVSDDPYDWIMALIRKNSPPGPWREQGSLEVPDWLRPNPRTSDPSQITAEEFVFFIDDDGCRKYARKISDLVTNSILPNIPCMVAVDHSLTGGVLDALSKFYGPENFSVVVLDSHTDAVPMPSMAGAIQYDTEKNPESVHDPSDPLLYNRADSYNASSFLHHLLNEGIILGSNLYLLGISDYPPKKAFRINDSRIVSYVQEFNHLRQRGVKLISKKDCIHSPSKIRAVLKNIKTPCVYVSIDMDIGANIALQGVRFRQWQGLQEKQIYKIIDLLASAVSKKLIGLDVTEINARKAGHPFGSDEDRTYFIAANVINKLAFNISKD